MGRFLPCLTMISNGEINSAATAASAVAIAAFGSGAPKFQPAMIIVVTATPQIAATELFSALPISFFEKIFDKIPRAVEPASEECYSPECRERRPLEAQASPPMAARNTTPKNCAAMSAANARTLESCSIAPSYAN